MSNGEEEKLTGWLVAWSGGDEEALNQLAPVVYQELHRIARSRLAQEQPGHTLQPTALVNEAFLNLMGNVIDWQSRAHFYALCARLMRRILINHAKAKLAAKRGGGLIETRFDDNVATPRNTALEDLDSAIEALKKHDERKADLIELSVFGGLTYGEMTEVTGLSSSTLDRELRFAKAWLKDYLSG